MDLLFVRPAAIKYFSGLVGLHDAVRTCGALGGKVLTATATHEDCLGLAITWTVFDNMHRV